MSPPQWPTIIRQSGRVKVSTDGDGTLFELINADNGASANTPKAEVVLDYGQCEGGTPVFKINSASGAEPEILFRVVYSETYEGISKDTGDGPFFLFSSAMDSYRTVSHTVRPSPVLQEVKARFAQRSQRYQRITLETANASLAFSGIGFELARPRLPRKAPSRAPTRR
ncbi:unnamed protein product [Parascedosporium putredinis]|uniref:Uncharacterized protein n=1 Tax=Parascedosporium putredinis TaxID=1442378 RepID=A0A9P1MBR7_9PEZI|nr:unnamed protein product [Parascedosporium putredinis]CAI7996337.1 unnamed protein product [Parascedosporium putredinis]